MNGTAKQTPLTETALQDEVERLRRENAALRTQDTHADRRSAALM